MAQLTQKDFHGLLTVLRELYRPMDAATLPARILATLSPIIPADIRSYNVVDSVGRQFSPIVDPSDAWLADGDQLFIQHVAEHPLVLYHQCTGDGQAVKISDFLSQRQFRRLGLYNEIYKRLSVKTQIAFTLSTSSSTVIGVALNRSQQDFSERERLLINLLRPHLIQAYQQAGELTQVRKEFT